MFTMIFGLFPPLFGFTRTAAAARPRRCSSHTDLAKHVTHWIGATAGTEVRCVQGTLWLTYDGQQRDIVLRAGESHSSDRGGRLAVHALEAAQYRATLNS